MRLRVLAALALAFAVSLAAPLAGAHRNFIPDWTFTGSALTGWQPLGPADWRAENGEIVATPRTAEGGWLVLDQSFQDVQVAASVRCAAACRPGLLLRAQKLADGTMKGILVSYAPGDAGAYAVTIDAQGAITSRDKLRSGGGQTRFVANPDGTAPYVNAPPGGGAAGTPAPPAAGPGAGAPAGRAAPAGAPGAAGAPGGPGGGGRVRAGMPDGIPTPY
ncbi:MAG: DUF1080 domain-containing protein, partial [Acidobacteria bacterium]|nr:DUF1080 domain-containing protein [Acidobacteriota bacterium]